LSGPNVILEGQTIGLSLGQLCVPVQGHGHSGYSGHHLLDVLGHGLGVAGQDRVVDQEQRLLRRERHVEHAEQGHESGVSFVPATTRLAHGCQVADVTHVLPVEVLAAVVAAAALQQQLEQGNRLLGAVRVHLK